MNLEQKQEIEGWICSIIEEESYLPSWLGTLSSYMAIQVILCLDVPEDAHYYIAAAAISIATKIWDDIEYFIPQDLYYHLEHKEPSLLIISEMIILGFFDYRIHSVTEKCFFMQERQEVFDEIVSRR